jgi:hypothetical protein
VSWLRRHLFIEEPNQTKYFIIFYNVLELSRPTDWHRAQVRKNLFEQVSYCAPPPPPMMAESAATIPLCEVCWESNPRISSVAWFVLLALVISIAGSYCLSMSIGRLSGTSNRPVYKANSSCRMIGDCFRIRSKFLPSFSVGVGYLRASARVWFCHGYSRRGYIFDGGAVLHLALHLQTYQSNTGAPFQLRFFFFIVWTAGHNWFSG